MCDGWRSGDSKESSSESETTDQTKKAWFDKQEVNCPGGDKTRFEPFTVIPNFDKGELSFRTIEDRDDADAKIIPYFPKGVWLEWCADSNWIAWRDAKTEDLKMYLENGNIVSKSPKVGKPLVWKYLGKWK
jgi:hypothetical protein